METTIGAPPRADNRSSILHGEKASRTRQIRDKIVSEVKDINWKRVGINTLVIAGGGSYVGLCGMLAVEFFTAGAGLAGFFLGMLYGVLAVAGVVWVIWVCSTGW